VNERAKAFASLHRLGDPLLLPNAWDVASAVAIAAAGAKAIATTSAGVAWSLGVPDGAELGAERLARSG
jgi:2-methylisocitrate lyase-like PEP mutase family enzyme